MKSATVTGGFLARRRPGFCFKLTQEQREALLGGADLVVVVNERDGEMDVDVEIRPWGLA